MPSIPIADGLSLNAEAELAPWSSLAKYAQELPKQLGGGANLSNWKVLTLADPAVQKLDAGLSLERPIPLGAGAPAVTLGIDSVVHFEVITGRMFSPDVYGDNIAIPPGQCAVRLGVGAKTTAGASFPAGSVTFGLSADAGIEIDSYRCFPCGANAPTVLNALGQALGELVIPFQAADVTSMPAGTVVTMGGRGSLKFSASASLLALANPLATVTLPAPLPGLAVSQGASVKVGASWTIECEYQARVQKVDAGHIRLGWYRKHSSDFSVTASARAGISAGTASADLFTSLIGAISSDAHANIQELQNAGLDAVTTASIEDTVKRAVSRKLEVGMAAEFGSLQRDEAAFLYELDLAALDDAGRTALGQALRGDLSGLAEPPRGVTEVRSILRHAAASRFIFKINLLGIFNFASVARLALDGTVTWTPSTGELVLVDKATAVRVQTGAVNFGADEQKLRHVMAESFLITAAYRGSKTAIASPALKSTHAFFRLENACTTDELRRFRMALEAVALNPQPLPPGPGDFGRTTMQLEADYDDTASQGLFLNSAGQARTVEEYERIGRTALQLLIPSNGIDAFRLRPAAVDSFWKQMKDLGPANFNMLLPADQAPVVAADYLAIRWWADEMHGTAVLVEQVLRLGAANSTTLRENLAGHLRGVADRAHEQFGSPWGLIAMYLASGGRAVATGSITSPRFVFASVRNLMAAG